MSKYMLKCARCGKLVRKVEFVVKVRNLCGIVDDEKDLVLCEQCFTTLKEVFEDGEIV